MWNRRRAPVLLLLFNAVWPSDASAQSQLHLPKGQHELPTTSAAIYENNLNSQFRSASRRVAQTPSDVGIRKILSNLHYLRGQYHSDLDEIQQAIDHASVCLHLAPDAIECWLLRARQQLSLHRFERARMDLERAKALGADTVAISAIEQELDWNAGRYPEAVAAIRHAASAKPTLWTLARLARLEHDLGNFKAAEQAFQAAEAAVTDVDPLPIAWLNVQRGLHYLERGEPALAIVFYREAVRRLPDYVLASEHLAEALALHGRVNEAITRYERIISQTPHAESLAALARLYRQQGRLAKAEVLKDKAAQRYEALLRTYPEAMQWHAAEFFLGIGQDPRRALTLLERNLALRPTGESWAALARAQLINGRLTDACQSMERTIAVSSALVDLK